MQTHLAAFAGPPPASAVRGFKQFRWWRAFEVLMHLLFYAKLVVVAYKANGPLERVVAFGNAYGQFHAGRGSALPCQVDHAATREHRPFEVPFAHGLAEEAKRV